MKKVLILCIFISLLSSLFAQKQMVIMFNERSAGRNFQSNTDVRAKEWTFPKTIRSYYLDTANNHLTLQLGGQITIPSGTGRIAVFDLNSNSLLWSKSFNYNTNSLLQSGEIIIQARADCAFRLNSETGKKLLRMNTQLFYIDDFTGIGLGYIPSAESSKLEGIRLSDGKPVWWRKISREYGWNDITPIEDGSVLLSAAGIHTIDLSSGSGNDFEAITGSKDYTGTVAANAAGIILGALTGYYSLYSGYDLVSEICSNVWTDSTGYCFASREKIARLDSQLKPVWVTELPRKKVSRSGIFTNDSLIYMINFGYAIKNQRMVHFGDPFFAAYNIENGRQAFLNEISDKKEIISDYITGKNMVICLFKDKIAGYSLQDGYLNIENKIDTKRYGNLKGFSTNEYFVETDSGFYPVDLLNPDELFVSTDSSQILSMNDSFEVTGYFTTKDFYLMYQDSQDLQLLWKDDKTIVIDAKHSKVAELDASQNSVYINGRLYDIQNRKFIEYRF